MLYNAKKFPGFTNFLPKEEREVDKLPRAYVSNLIFTIVGSRFKEWVEQKVQDRTNKIMQDQDMAIEMDPEVYKAFKASTNVSGKFSIG